MTCTSSLWPGFFEIKDIDNKPDAHIVPRFWPRVRGATEIDLFFGKTMYAVIRTGGKQHRVAANDRIIVERLKGAPGELVSFDHVLMLHDREAAPLIGDAVPKEARVFAEVVAQQRGPKVLVFKKQRRKNYRRLNGHRQEQTVLRITAISPDGEEPVLEQDVQQTKAPETSPAQEANLAPASEAASVTTEDLAGADDAPEGQKE